MDGERVGLIGGTGDEGQGIALRLAMGGVAVEIGSRSQEKARQVVGELSRQLALHGFEGTRMEGVENHVLLRECGLLFLTVPFDHAVSTLESLREGFREGHVLVDVTVPLRFERGPQLLDLEEGSGAEHLRRIVPEGIPMAAAFKTLPAHLLCEIGEPLDCDDFLCADSEVGRQRVLEVVERVEGLRWINAGPLRYCRSLEAMTMLAIGLNQRYKSRAARFRVLGVA